MLIDTVAPASSWSFISQSFFHVLLIFSFIHSVPCQPLKVLVAPRLLFSGTLERDLVGLAIESVIWAHSSKNGLVFIFRYQMLLADVQ